MTFKEIFCLILFLREMDEEKKSQVLVSLLRKAGWLILAFGIFSLFYNWKVGLFCTLLGAGWSLIARQYRDDAK